MTNTRNQQDAPATGLSQAGLFVPAISLLCQLLCFLVAIAESRGDTDPFVLATAAIKPSVAAVGSYLARDNPSVRYAGTGFVVDDGFKLVTNAHVIASIRDNQRIEQLRVFFPEENNLEGRIAIVIGEDPKHDLALLKIQGKPIKPLDLSLEEPPQGLAIGIIGFPIGNALGLVPAVHKGVLSAIVPAVLPLPKGANLNPLLVQAIQKPYSFYQLDIVSYPGNSGSPLFNAQDGRVLGIINKTLASRTREHLLTAPSGISFAITSRWINNLIHSTSSDQPATGNSPADLSDENRR